MRKSKWIILLAVLLVLALSTGALAAKGVNILGLAAIVASEEGEGEPEDDLLSPGLKEEDPENDNEGDPEEDEEDAIGARDIFPELEGREFGQAISELAKTYPGAVADALRELRGEEPKGPPPHEDDDDDLEEGELETASTKSNGKGKPAFVGKPNKK